VLPARTQDMLDFLQKDGSTHIPLNHLSTKTGDGDASGRFSAVSSPLSEFAVAGFELGYSWESPRGLVLWEVGAAC
jgi:2-oxoglutarate dehydrogenase E1 component